jgi:predicted DNA-binding transcriptional regulator AlpA
MPKRARLLTSTCPPLEVASAERKIAPAHTAGGPPEDDPFIGTSEVANELMCHPVSVFRFLRERPDFPVPMWISPNRLAWRRSVIRAYVASRPLRKTRSVTRSG